MAIICGEFGRESRRTPCHSFPKSYHLIIANDLQLIENSSFKNLTSQIENIRKMLTGLEKRLSGDADKKKPRSAGSR